MANKRMFDKAIIDTDRFMDLPMSGKALYFLLGMEADDEGFVSYKKVIRIHGGNDDDIKILISKDFLIGFPSGVVVITDWNSNNWLNTRRIKSTEYQREKKLIALTNNKKYVLSSRLASIEESSIEENRIEESSLADKSAKENPNQMTIQDLYNNMGIPKRVKSVKLWQDEAANAVKYFTDGENKRSSIFKCFKDREDKAKFAFSDCKELGKPSALYFLKVYNELIK